MERKRALAPTEMVVGQKYIAQPKNGKPPSKPMTLKELNSKGNPVFSNVAGLNSVFGAGRFDFYGYYDPETGLHTANDPRGDALLDALGIAAGAGFTHNTAIARPLHPETYRPGEPGALANMFSRTLPQAQEARALQRRDVVANNILYTSSSWHTGRTVIDNCTPLVEAAVQGNDRRVRELLAFGADNEEIVEDAGPLIWATRAGQTRVVEDLLRRPGRSGPVDVNKPDLRNYTALGTAIETRKIELVKVLLDHGADPNALAGINPPCILALKLREEDICRLLLEKGADPTKTDRLWGNALDNAVRTGCDSIAIELLDRGLKFERFDFVDFPNVCARGNVELIGRLLDLGIDVNELYDERRGLISAVRNNKVDAVRFLYEKGADPTLTDGYDRNAYDWANPEMLDILNEYRSIANLEAGNIGGGGSGSGSGGSGSGSGGGGGSGSGGWWSWVRGKKTRKRKVRKSRKSRKV